MASDRKAHPLFIAATGCHTWANCKENIVTRKSLILTLFLATPAMAETGMINPLHQDAGGAVAQLVLAQNVFALAQTRNDTLAVIAAGCLAATIVPNDVPRQPDDAAEVAASPYPDTPEMFAVAQKMAAGNDLQSEVLNRAMRSTPRLTARMVTRSALVIAPAAQQTFRIPFFGAALAEVAILGDGTANLDLDVADPAKATVCLAHGPTDRAYCDFVPAENAIFTVTVTNRSDAPATYALVTN